MKYINAEKLITEIEKLQQEIINKWKDDPRSSIDDGFLTACSQFLDVITSLQQEQPTINLGREIDRYCETIHAWQVQEAPFTSLENCARHFYELGLNTRKENN